MNKQRRVRSPSPKCKSTTEKKKRKKKKNCPVTIPTVNVKKICHDVEVKAEDLDIRNLCPNKDGVLFYGLHDNKEIPVRVDHKGRIEIVQQVYPESRYVSHQFLDITTTNTYTPLPSQDCAYVGDYSYAIINQGNAPVSVIIEISPNNQDFYVDQTEIVAANSNAVLVPMRFLRWTRISVRSQIADSPTVIDVYYQGQTTG